MIIFKAILKYVSREKKAYNYKVDIIEDYY